MSGRWLVRLIGILMLLGFLILFANLQKRLMELQRSPQPARTTTR